MRSRGQSRSFGCKLINEKGSLQAAHWHKACFVLRGGNQCSNESFIHSLRLLLAVSRRDHSVAESRSAPFRKEKQ
jgi:hypothetical protein